MRCNVCMRHNLCRFPWLEKNQNHRNKRRCGWFNAFSTLFFLLFCLFFCCFGRPPVVCRKLQGGLEVLLLLAAAAVVACCCCRCFSCCYVCCCLFAVVVAVVAVVVLCDCCCCCGFSARRGMLLWMDGCAGCFVPRTCCVFLIADLGGFGCWYSLTQARAPPPPILFFVLFACWISAVTMTQAQPNVQRVGMTFRKGSREASECYFGCGWCDGSVVVAHRLPGFRRPRASVDVDMV